MVPMTTTTTATTTTTTNFATYSDSCIGHEEEQEKEEYQCNDHENVGVGVHAGVDRMMILDTWKALCANEEQLYNTRIDYLNPLTATAAATTAVSARRRTTTTTTNNTTSRRIIDNEFRCQMILWCYNVIDYYYKSNRSSIGEYCIYYLDCYMSTITKAAAAIAATSSYSNLIDDDTDTDTNHSCTNALYDERTYQLVVVTCLYIAIKVHGNCIGNSSKGIYGGFDDCDCNDTTNTNTNIGTILSSISYDITYNDIIQMEQHILSTLRWLLHPPTTYECITIIVQHLQYYCNNNNNNNNNNCNCNCKNTTTTTTSNDVLEQSQLQMIQQLAYQQTQLAIQQYEYSTIKASIVAYCAVLNAIDCMNITATTTTTTTTTNAIVQHYIDSALTVLYNIMVSTLSSATTSLSTMSSSSLSSSSTNHSTNIDVLKIRTIRTMLYQSISIRAQQLHTTIICQKRLKVSTTLILQVPTGATTAKKTEQQQQQQDQNQQQDQQQQQPLTDDSSSSSSGGSEEYCYENNSASFTRQ